MKLFHDYDEPPPRDWTATEAALIAKLMKAEAQETIRRRNLDRRWRDMPEEFAGMKPPAISPNAGRISVRAARTVELDNHVMRAIVAGYTTSAHIEAHTGIPGSTVQSVLLRLRNAGRVTWETVNIGLARNIYVYSPSESPPAPAEPVAHTEVAETASAAVAPNPEGIGQTFLSKRKPGMPVLPWEREAAE